MLIQENKWYQNETQLIWNVIEPNTDKAQPVVGKPLTRV